MQRRFCFLLAFLFLANTTVVLAWHPPCPSEERQTSEAVELTGHSMPDCHKKLQTQSKNHAQNQAQIESTKQIETSGPPLPGDDVPESMSHCDGLCLCAQACSSPSFNLVAGRSDVFAVQNVTADGRDPFFPESIQIRPLLRPPNLPS